MGLILDCALAMVGCWFLYLAWQERTDDTEFLVAGLLLCVGLAIIGAALLDALRRLVAVLGLPVWVIVPVLILAALAALRRLAP